jgi:hypothetical protein
MLSRELWSGHEVTGISWRPWWCGSGLAARRSNEEGNKGRIQVGQFGDMIVPDRDYLSCADDEIADTASVLTVVGGKVVYGAGDFASFDQAELPPAMPEWSPVRTFGGYGAWGG